MRGFGCFHLHLQEGCQKGDDLSASCCILVASGETLAAAMAVAAGFAGTSAVEMEGDVHLFQWCVATWRLVPAAMISFCLTDPCFVAHNFQKTLASGPAAQPMLHFDS